MKLLVFYDFFTAKIANVILFNVITPQLSYMNVLCESQPIDWGAIKMPGDVHLHPKQIPTDITAFGAIAVAGPAFVVVIMIARCLQQQPPSGNLEKESLLLTSPRENMTHDTQEPLRKLEGRKVGKRRDLESCFYWTRGQSASGFVGSLFTGECKKHKSRN